MREFVSVYLYVYVIDPEFKLTDTYAYTRAQLFLSLNLFDAWLTGVEEVCCGPFGGESKVNHFADPCDPY